MLLDCQTNGRNENGRKFLLNVPSRNGHFNIFPSIPNKSTTLNTNFGTRSPTKSLVRLSLTSFFGHSSFESLPVKISIKNAHPYMISRWKLKCVFITALDNLITFLQPNWIWHSEFSTKTLPQYWQSDMLLNSTMYLFHLAINMAWQGKIMPEGTYKILQRSSSWDISSAILPFPSLELLDEKIEHWRSNLKAKPAVSLKSSALKLHKVT